VTYLDYVTATRNLSECFRLPQKCARTEWPGHTIVRRCVA
jgi:hypothetical protein